MSRPVIVMSVLRDIAKNAPNYELKMEAVKLLLLLSGRANEQELGFEGKRLPKSLKGNKPTGLEELAKETEEK